MVQSPPSPEFGAGLPSRTEVVRANIRLVAESARGSVLLVGMLQVVGGLLGGALLFSAGRVIEGLTGAEADWPATWPWIVALAVIMTLSGLIDSAGREQQRLIVELVNLHTSEQLMRAAAAVSFDRFDSDAFYDRMRRAREGSQGSATQIVLGTLTATRTLIDASVIVVLVAAVAPVVLPIALAAYVPLFLASRWSNRVLHRFSWALTEDDRLRGYLASLFTDRSAAREVRMFDLGTWFGRRHSALWSDRIRRLRVVIRRRILVSGIGSLLSSAIIAVALGVVAWMASRGDLSLADAGVAILGVHRLSGAVNRLNAATASLHQGGLHMRDYEAFIAEAEAEAPARPELPTPLPRIDEIALRGVTFRYPATTRNAVSGVSLTIRRGEVVALVGPNGAGKSTLMLLLCGLYAPTDGTVSWDGVDTASLDPSALRAAISPMFQDFTRYQLTVRENVAVSDMGGDETSERIDAALAEAGAEPIVDGLQHGVGTRLSRAYESGTELSAGQWQRLALARALYHPGALQVLDEPTADLDVLAEQQLVDALRARAADRCTVFSSHRFAAVRRADRIVVLDEGRIVEDGTHQELMAARGLYRAMYDSHTGLLDDPIT